MSYSHIIFQIAWQSGDQGWESSCDCGGQGYGSLHSRAHSPMLLWMEAEVLMEYDLTSSGLPPLEKLKAFLLIPPLKTSLPDCCHLHQWSSPQRCSQSPHHLLPTALLTLQLLGVGS